jgi:hypothetical protein
MHSQKELLLLSKKRAMVEEILDAGRGKIKVLKEQNRKIFLLTKNNRIRLVLYKEPTGLKTNIKGGDKTGIYTSSRGKMG